MVLASVADPALSAMAADVGRRVRCTTPPRPSAPWRCASAPPQVLQRLGVHVIDAEPEDLPVALTDHYLLLKSRGLL